MNTGPLALFVSPHLNQHALLGLTVIFSNAIDGPIFRLWDASRTIFWSLKMIQIIVPNVPSNCHKSPDLECFWNGSRSFEDLEADHRNVEINLQLQFFCQFDIFGSYCSEVTLLNINPSPVIDSHYGLFCVLISIYTAFDQSINSQGKNVNLGKLQRSQLNSIECKIGLWWKCNLAHLNWRLL